MFAWFLPRRNGAPSALNVLRPGWPLLHGSEALCLPWRDARQGPKRSIAAQRFVCTVLWEDHVRHMEGVTLPVWKSMPCERALKLLDRGRNFLFPGLIFVPPDSASLLLGSTLNNDEASQKLFLLLNVREPPFEEALDWL